MEWILVEALAGDFSEVEKLEKLGGENLANFAKQLKTTFALCEHRGEN